MLIPDSDFTTKWLESLAVAQRLDLRAAHGAGMLGAGVLAG